MTRPDSRVIWLERNSLAYFGEDGKLRRMVGMVADVTERKRAEEMLGNLNRRLIEGQEADRARIARDLHDDIGQKLVLIAVKLGQLSEFKVRTDEFRKSMVEMQEYISEVSSNVHELSHQLHSSSLEHLGLTAATRSYCKEISGKHGIDIHFISRDVPPILPSEISLCLFRVLQEALQNAVKHSKAQGCEVELSGDLRSVLLKVRDLGAGFDVEAAMNGTGLGLVSMRERLKLVNGEFSVESELRHGTTISARVPLPQVGAVRAAS
jgi:signal transduction histidine kinase